MRKITALFTAFCVLFSIIISFSIQAYAENEINIIFTVGDKKLEAVLYDNSTTRELISKMPMTLPMMDLYDREMCYRFSDALPVDDVQNTNYEVGEIIYWPPGHSFVIMYEQNGEEFDMQKLGFIKSGVDIFKKTGNIDVKVELANKTNESITENEIIANDLSKTDNKNTIQTNKEIKVTVGSDIATIGGKAVKIDVAPYVQTTSNSTLVPLRFVSLALNDNTDNSENIKWNDYTKTVTIINGSKNIEFTANSNIVKIDGKEITMNNEAKAEIKDGRIYVPFRTLGEALGVETEWEQNTKTAIYIMEDNEEMNNINPNGGIFGLGEQKSFTEKKESTFTGNVWVKSLVSSEQRSAVSNVSFSCCSRTDWHSHPNGQILLVTEGRGYYQIKGEQAHEIKPGDSVLIEPGVVHWHGGGNDTPMSHVAITVNRKTEWGAPVTDEEYNMAIKSAISSEAVSTNDPALGSIFNLGNQISEKNSDNGTFTGDVWLNSFIKASEKCPSAFSNVNFAPCSRTDWHSHPSGQILLVTGGKGYVQIEGESIQELKSGDVAEIASGVTHWHGAAPGSYFNHVAITIDNKTDWYNPVSDEEYNSAISKK